MWMNQADIEWAYRKNYTCPNMRKAVNLLYRLMEAVNCQSDGWPYWKAPAQAASKLMEIVHNARENTVLSDADLKAAITPIRTMVTRQKKLQAKYGNTFDFNVSEALK